MRLSVVLPVLNEAAGIVNALLPLQPVRDRIELLVVDGGSSDNSCELARPLADRVLVSGPGRARQMNVGAAAARGDVLLFLHADTQLPDGFVALIEAAVFGQPAIAARPPLPPNPAIPTPAIPDPAIPNSAIPNSGTPNPATSPTSTSTSTGGSGGPAAIAPTQHSTQAQPHPQPPTQTGGSGGLAAIAPTQHSTQAQPHPQPPIQTGGSGGLAAIAIPPNSAKLWGRFDVRLTPTSPLLNLVAWMMNQRSRLTGICTGDQAIFVRRDLFDQLGGYADIPLMEDIDLSHRLRKISSPACLRPPVTTSSRKWQKHGVWRTICLMWWIRLQYWAGVSPERLVRQYYGAAPKSQPNPEVSSSTSTQQRQPRHRWPRWNSAFPGTTKTNEQAQSAPESNPGVSSSTSTQQRQLRHRWPRWNSAFPGTTKTTEQAQSTRAPTPGVSSSTSTQQRQPQRRWPRWNSAFPGTTNTTEQAQSAPESNPGVSSSTSTPARPETPHRQTTRPLLIFAKAPIPGTVKTRLMPALGAAGACDLYQQLLRHTLKQTGDWPGQRFLYCAPDTTHPLFARLASEHHLQLRQQYGDDLGSRMAQALAEHPGGGLLIGTDCPLISTAVLLEADQALATHDTAIIPSEDGGYVMIGQRQPDTTAFTDMRWSHPQVMANTRQRLAAAGMTLWEGPVLWDLDEPADLPRLDAIPLMPL
ncbi:TIGR04282 family arsenosugar biosynthesis glycosyltransferase [Halopseudomonas pelagia]|uniref:TIGR04282 family arsenosugar biosynthesis glycosyltransferase n=1 Tax=Halopseudomonas pelagia TaxID=553151 RepID=UPI0030D95A35